MPDPISWSHAAPYLIGALLGGYLLGSVPYGLVLTRLFGLGDIRKIGSGNIGTTNVLRTGRKDLAAATLILDGGKGAAAVLLAAFWGPDAAIMAGYGAVLGHMFSIWLKFRGGKSVATTLGVLLAVAWPVGVACCLTWLLVAAVSRISSLSALLCFAAGPVFAWVLMHDLQLVQMAIILAVLVWIRHHGNIRRLVKGQEPRIGKSKT